MAEDELVRFTPSYRLCLNYAEKEKLRQLCEAASLPESQLLRLLIRLANPADVSFWRDGEHQHA